MMEFEDSGQTWNEGVNDAAEHSDNHVSFLRETKHFTRWLAKDMAVLEYFTGDVDKVPEALRQSLDNLKERKGNELYSDLLFALIHTRYSPAEARYLWQEIIKHKYFISEKLGRNIGVKVAALDYFDNQSGRNKAFQLLPEQDLESLLFFVNEDGLTGLYNHRYFQEELREELKRCTRYNRTFSLLIIDLDHFKEYNDHLGHRQGDILLKEVSNLFKSNCREEDTVSRYGGDEFTIILPETNAKEALRLTSRLFEAFKVSRISQMDASRKVKVSLSIGIATFPENALAAEELIEVADQALYRAKASGRNCIRQAHQKVKRKKTGL